MKFEIIAECEINGYPGACSKFPGVARFDNGNLVMLFCNAGASEAVDQQMYIARSCDRGRSWQVGGPMYDYSKLPFVHPFNDSCKPVAIGGNELVAIGYGFERDEPELSLTAYAEKYGRFPNARNLISRSLDGGRSWSVPEFIEHEYPALEFSGPALWCPDENKLLAFGPPFVLKNSPQRGICFAGTDRGRQWKEYATFWASPSVAPWEVRATRTADGRIILVIWAFDLASQQHLNNFIVWSDDCGRTWSKPFDTKLLGQAANWRIADDGIYLLYTRREGNEPGLLMNKVTFSGDTPVIGEGTMIWSASGLANSGTRIEEQFRNLKFGQPSMLNLGNGEEMLVFWSCENNVYSIKTKILCFK